MSNFLYCFSVKSVCFSNLLTNGDYSDLLTAGAFSDNYFSDKTYLLVTNSDILIFPDDKAEILAIYLSKSYWDFFCYIFLWITNSHSYNNFFLNWNELSDEKVVSFTENENCSLV